MNQVFKELIFFVLAFENDAQRTSHSDYNVIINREDFFDKPIKNNKRTYGSIRKIATSQGDDYTTDYPYLEDTYTMIPEDLSKQQELDAKPKANHQINFTANLDRAGNTGIYFILEDSIQ